jgi:hypothetical protein
VTTNVPISLDAAMPRQCWPGARKKWISLVGGIAVARHWPQPKAIILPFQRKNEVFKVFGY